MAKRKSKPEAPEPQSPALRLTLRPGAEPRRTLDELLAQCDPRAPRSIEDREWLDDRPAGGELIC
jgi:antitoxin ChpS